MSKVEGPVALMVEQFGAIQETGVQFPAGSNVFHMDYLTELRVNSPNSGCQLNIGNGPQSGTPLQNKANQLIMGLKAAKRPINL